MNVSRNPDLLVALPAGSRLGPHEILSALGAGGMGEVYRARDTKLNREVAIKVLPDACLLDPDRLARFQREAQVLASLNHPNIGAIYGLEQSGGAQALVLELVEGPTLADRLLLGRIPIDEALPIACQIAEALESAHERGIVHRDLKPANVKLRPDGTVKVLDFGIAKVFEKTPLPAAPTRSHAVDSPAATLDGVILGTVAYMSPEQARGKAVDERTDIWAFGCVLFEMVTGKKPFDGETLTDTIAAIVKNEPDWSAIPAGTPASIRSLIARCLRKDLAERLHSIADGRFRIEEVLKDPEGTPTVSRGRNRREWLAWTAAAVFLGLAVFLAARRSATSSAGDAIVTVPILPPEGTTFSSGINFTVSVPSFALSPDGRAVVFTANPPRGRPTLWVRSMDKITARQLEGTEGAQDPIWSPDSRWIAFFADRRLKKIPAAGGAVEFITQSGLDVRGAAWGPEDTILFGAGTNPILSVSAAGGSTTPVTVIDASSQEVSHRYPQFLPDGRHFIYSIFGANHDHNGVYAGSLDGKTKKALLHLQTTAAYAPPGYLLFVDGDTLKGQAFNAERLEFTGPPFLIAEHVGRNTGWMSGVSASRTGAIAYAGTISQNGRLMWIDRHGNSLGSPGTAEGDYTDFRLSPDEKRLAESLVDPKTNAVEIWLTDLARGSTARVDFGALLAASVLWSPDGTRIFFRSNRNGIIEFFARSAAGGGDARLILPAEVYRESQMTPFLVPTDWSQDGRTVIFSAPSPGSGNDLWLLPLGEGGHPAKFIASPADEMHGNFSPDGRLVAYTSDVSGKFEVYIETVPRSDREWSVSTNGGYEPRWRADGREIYYLSPDRKLMAVPVGPGPSFGIPAALFQTQVPSGVTPIRTHYVPSRDGRRFLVEVAADQVALPITVVLNWTAALGK